MSWQGDFDVLGYRGFTTNMRNAAILVAYTCNRVSRSAPLDLNSAPFSCFITVTMDDSV